jgi:hypothetical protein
MVIIINAPDAVLTQNTRAFLIVIDARDGCQSGKEV